MRYAILLTVFAVLVVAEKHAQAAIKFVLESGATITPIDGTPETLSGYFIMEQYDTGSTIIGFDATELRLHSASFTLDLHPNNDQGTGLTPDGITSFSEVVDVTGLLNATLYIQSDTGGTYEGMATSPTRLIYPDVGLWPVGGGQIEAKLVFSAIAVPEPTTSAFLVAALTCTAFARWRLLAAR
jgi:hypothetical protein